MKSSFHSRTLETKSFLHSRTFNSQLNWIAPVVFFITSRRGSHRKHRSSIVACVFFSAGTCFPRSYSETAVCLFDYFISTAVLVVCFEDLPSKGSIRHNIFPFPTTSRLALKTTQPPVQWLQGIKRPGFCSRKRTRYFSFPPRPDRLYKDYPASHPNGTGDIAARA
jgi:hypothetical protein